LLRAVSRSEEFAEVALVDIETSSFLNFRVNLEDTKEFDELSESIRKVGLLQPLIVRPIGNTSAGKSDRQHFQLISGHRRYAACKRLGLRTSAVRIMDLSDQKALEVALVENLQRQSLNPIEEAEAFKSYVMIFGRGSITRLANKIGKSEEYVSHRLLLLGLPKEILERISRRLLNGSHAMELVWLRRSDLQLSLSKEILERDLSIREVRSIITTMKHGSLSLDDAVRQVISARVSRNKTIPPITQQGSVSPNSWSSYHSQESSEARRADIYTLERAVLVVRGCLAGLDLLVNDISDTSNMRNILMEPRRNVHAILDELVDTSARFKRN
jgi:ParB/RepB/Spo0J family partition protein